MKKKDKTAPGNPHKKQNVFTLREKISAWWRGKNPVLRFSLGFALLMGVFYAFWFTHFFTNNILLPFTRFNALIAAAVLGIFGYHPAVIDAKLSSQWVTIDVGRGCDALEPMAIFVVAVFLFPAQYRSKIIGILCGVPVLFVFNLMRIITLFLAGVHGDFLFGDKSEFYFNLLHLQVWPAVFILLTLLLLAFWIIYSLKKRVTN